MSRDLKIVIPVLKMVTDKKKMNSLTGNHKYLVKNKI